MGEISIDIIGGSHPCSMRLDLDPDLPNENTILSYIGAGRFYEPDVAEVFLRVLREGDVVVDVGGNAGFFTMLGAALVGSSGQMLSFEPDPVNCARLRRNVALNAFGQVTVLENPATSRVGRVEFFINSDDSGGNALWDPALYPGNVRSQVARQVLSMAGTTIDAELAQRDIGAVKLLKIDTEGADHTVLQGARRLLAEHRATFVVCELHEFGLAQMGSSQDALRGFMAEFGYESFVLYYNGRLPHLVPRGTAIRAKHFCNVLFSRAEDVGRYWTAHQHVPGSLLPGEEQL